MGSGIRGIVVCVNYADLLRITLPLNMRFLDECVVVTSGTDIETQELCTMIPGVRVCTTEAFTAFGAKFNKGLAIEEGFFFLGRDGWILIWDADIIFPDDILTYANVDQLEVGNLYGMPRKILLDPKEWHPEFNWKRTHRTVDRDIPGYFQLFRADDPHIAQLPWYDVTFAHAGGGDGYFASRWPKTNKVKFTDTFALHLGPRDTNWFGRASERTDGKTVEQSAENKALMERYLSYKGWGRPCTVDSFEHERIEVPGHAPSEFRLLGTKDVPLP